MVAFILITIAGIGFLVYSLVAENKYVLFLALFWCLMGMAGIAMEAWGWLAPDWLLMLVFGGLFAWILLDIFVFSRLRNKKR